MFKLSGGYGLFGHLEHEEEDTAKQCKTDTHREKVQLVLFSMGDSSIKKKSYPNKQFVEGIFLVFRDLPCW